jgi:hypothetical protein
MIFLKLENALSEKKPGWLQSYFEIKIRGLLSPLSTETSFLTWRHV